MRVELSLFGAFRDLEPRGSVALDVDGEHVRDLRVALEAHASARWPAFQPGLLAVSAFASEESILREDDRLPADGKVAILPPVSGG